MLELIQLFQRYNEQLSMTMYSKSRSEIFVDSQNILLMSVLNRRFLSKGYLINHCSHLVWRDVITTQ
jgi:hypothetical protein